MPCIRLLEKNNSQQNSKHLTNLTWLILGDPGAASWDITIFLGKSLHQEWSFCLKTLPA